MIVAKVYLFRLSNEKYATTNIDPVQNIKKALLLLKKCDKQVPIKFIFIFNKQHILLTQVLLLLLSIETRLATGVVDAGRMQHEVGRSPVPPEQLSYDGRNSNRV